MEINIEDRTFDIDNLPERCPFCHELAIPAIKGANLNASEESIPDWELFLKCSNKNCQKSFIGYYSMIGNNEFGLFDISKGAYKQKDFPVVINSISPKFKEIYNQAFIAEQEKLAEICGMGYRKALEFLVKDYCIYNNKGEKRVTEEMYLSNVIDKYIDNQEIRDIAERAIWLGNDETHYLRIWDNYNVSDLKVLLDAIIAGIELNSLHKKVIEEMPKKNTMLTNRL